MGLRTGQNNLLNGSCDDPLSDGMQRFSAGAWNEYSWAASAREPPNTRYYINYRLLETNKNILGQAEVMHVVWIFEMQNVLLYEQRHFLFFYVQ